MGLQARTSGKIVRPTFPEAHVFLWLILGRTGRGLHRLHHFHQRLKKMRVALKQLLCELGGFLNCFEQLLRCHPPLIRRIRSCELSVAIPAGARTGPTSRGSSSHGSLLWRRLLESPA